MKATGIVRRIDDLGRVVIPKEIRQNYHIKEGDPLEIYTGDGGITLKKYFFADNVLDLIGCLHDIIVDEAYLGEYKTDLLQKVQEMKQILKQTQEV